MRKKEKRTEVRN